MRVPLGVVAIIYESRPNVTADSAALCLKSGNVCVLRGGSEAIHSNTAIAAILSDAAQKAGVPSGAITFVDRADREVVPVLLKQDQAIDLIIPRGGLQLIEMIVANARVLAQGLLDRGYKIVSGGTDTHLFLVNLTNKGITGKEADAALDAAGIILNKNAVPYDEKPPAVASGIRIGSPIVSTRGMREAEMKEIVELIDRVLQNRQNAAVLEEVRAHAKALCGRFPIFHSY